MPGRQVIIITILIIMIMIIIMIITFLMTMILITIIIFFHEHNVYGYQTLTVIFQRTCTDRQPCTATSQHQVLGKKISINTIEKSFMVSHTNKYFLKNYFFIDLSLGFKCH